MPPGIFPLLVKGCLCFSLFFTYPVMMLPVSTILDKAFNTQSKSMTSLSGVRFGGCRRGCVAWGLGAVAFVVHARSHESAFASRRLVFAPRMDCVYRWLHSPVSLW